MFGLDFNNLRDCALIECFCRARWHIEHNRELWLRAPSAAHKRAYLRWQVTSLLDLDRCYGALRQKTTAV